MTWILSAVPAFLAALVLDPGRLIPEQTQMQRILWSGGFFLLIYLAGFLGLSIGLAILSRIRGFRVRRSGNWLLVFLLGAVLIFGAGAGGQALFMRSEAVDEYHPTPVDVVLLLDDSSSMELYGYDGARTEGTCLFVDSLDENVRVQVIAFSGLVREYLPFTTADDAGKEQIKEGVRNIDLTGLTDFDLPLTAAAQSLTENGRADCQKAILLFTDGEASLADETVQKVIGSGAKLFCVRISGSDQTDEISADMRKLADLAVQTGGADIVLEPAADGTVNAEDLLTAFQTAFAAVVETIRVVPDGLLAVSAGITTYQWIIRVITILLIAVLTGIGFFGRIRPLPLILNLVSGAAFAIAIGAAGGQYLLVAVCGGILLGSAFVVLQIREKS